MVAETKQVTRLAASRGSGFYQRAARLAGRSSECNVLDELLHAVRAGASRVLVVRGEPGVGKSALLELVAARASGFRVVRVSGVQSEMELAFAGLHQLLGPILGQSGRLPAPQRNALQTALGVSTGPAPNLFLVGLAVLGLLSEEAAQQPLLCVIDDEQWLDQASAQALGFAARRMSAESIGMVFAARDPGDELTGLPELRVTGLSDDEARSLLDSALAGVMDDRIRDMIVAEAHGNPLALLELPRGLPPAELAGGFGLPGAVSLPRRIEESFRRQLSDLPARTQRLLQLAAADPTGDPLLVWESARRLGISAAAAAPAIEAGLVEFGSRVRFRHPLVRSAAYLLASLPLRQELHAALAESTDAHADPDRRAWHRAQAAAGPDEGVAAELERSAGRAQNRGGLAAAAAFLEKAAALTPEQARRSQRLLAAASAAREAGALGASLGLLVAVEARPLDALQTARVEILRGQIAADQNRGGEAADLLLSASRRLEPLDACLARETCLEALAAAMVAADLDRPGGLQRAAEAARAAPPAPARAHTADLMLDVLALWLTEGYKAAAPDLALALERIVSLDVEKDDAPQRLWFMRGRASRTIPLELWDFEASYALADRQVQIARRMGALVQLQFAVNFLGILHLLTGELSATAGLIGEDRLIAEATGNPPLRYAEMMLAAWQGREQEATALIAATARLARERGTGQQASRAACARAVLCNGLGRYDEARDAAREAFDRNHLGFGHLVVAELAEAAARTGDGVLLTAALDWLSERTQATPGDWVLGIESRVRALASDGAAADRLYCESIERLGRTPVRTQLARSRLLYGEWLRRQRRRTEAREQLRAAYRMLDAMGLDAFAGRAGRELQATGETARKRSLPRAAGAPASDALTAQEAQVARLARDGMSNPEIAGRLFISSRTVQYHLSSAFSKLGISSRGQLYRVLPADAVPGKSPWSAGGT
jgi:DNA-binding CsgD family transcriptional regulator